MSSSRDTSDRLKRALRQDRVARLFVEGASAAHVASTLDLPIVTVQRTIRHIRKLWQEILDQNFIETKLLELAKINRLEAEAWEAWKRSTEPQKTTKAILDGEKHRAESITKTQTGDTKYLEKIIWCIENRSEILSGLQAGSAESADALSDDQLRKRIAALLTVVGDRGRTETT